MNKIIQLKSLLFGAFVLASFGLSAQQNVGIGTTTPDPSALLDLSSKVKGTLITRMNTNEMNTIPAPATGLLVFNTDSVKFCYYDGTQWLCNLGNVLGGVGPQGPQGDTGPQGPAGINGVDGATGPQGPAGAQGAQGPAGPQGIQGDTGAQGPQGPAGAQGPTGAPGANGATGAQGPAGATGAQGATGAAGATGPAGATGATGAAGATGATGPAGPNQQVSAGVNEFGFTASTSGAWENVQTLTLNSNGNSVFVYASGSSVNYADFVGYRIMMDGTTFVCGGIADQYLISGAQNQWLWSTNARIPAVSAGSHTYTLQFYNSDSSTDNIIVEGYFHAVEIND